MDLQHAPSPQRTGTYIHELRTREGRRALAGAVPGLQCPSWDWPGTSAGRTAESTVRPARSARRVHPAKASDPAGSSRSQWPVASAPSPVSASAAFRRSSPVLVPESPARKAPKPSLALSTRQARNFPKLNRGDRRVAAVPRKRGAAPSASQGPMGLRLAESPRACRLPPVAAACRGACTPLPPPLPTLARRRQRCLRCPCWVGGLPSHALRSPPPLSPPVSRSQACFSILSLPSGPFILAFLLSVYSFL